MQLNKVLKGLLIAIPLVALTACSSSQNADSGGSGSTNADNDTSMQSGSNQNDNGSDVTVGTVDQQSDPNETINSQDTALLQKHTIYFEFDKSSVEYEYNEMLSAHARFLVKNPGQKITIEGHCDERGTPEYNIALGERRAKSVAKFLTTLGVSDSQINIVSYGEEKPVDKSRTESGFGKNRRAILVY